MSTLQEQRTRLARGRLLTRISIWLFGIGGALLLIFIALGIVARTTDWLPDTDDNTATIVYAALLGVSVFGGSALVITGRIMAVRSIKDVVAGGPDSEVPDSLRIGPAWPWWSMAGISVLLILGAITLVWWSRWSWKTPLAWLGLVYYAFEVVRLGPAAPAINSAFIDASGIRLPQLDVQVPWTSVSSMNIYTTGVRVKLEGPVEPIGRIPAFWARRALRRLQHNLTVDLSTLRQDKVIWVGQRYRHPTET